MVIMKTETGLEIITEGQRKNLEKGYVIKKGNNGVNCVTLNSVSSVFCSISEGNDKTGKNVINFNLPVEFTCNHLCECYKNKVCYACSGCYLWGNNQSKYSENLNYFNSVSSDEFIATVQIAIDEFKYNLFRFFTCGDIPNKRFLSCMVKIAENNPDIRFWSYTKKYSIVNGWIDENGSLPENLVIIFSHWLNDDGSFFPMDNKHNLPTSEFIPLGKEHLKDNVTHICPCSDPSVVKTCATCDHPCYTLKNGESMALLEHSTGRTATRDAEIRKSHETLKKAAKKAV